jgi:serine/threonine protein kinase
LVGTARYASVNAHLGIELSRRDDIESLGYVLVYLLLGSLPWQGLVTANRQEKYYAIQNQKMSIPPEILCENLPEEFTIFFNYVKSLKFEDKPDYYFLKKNFTNLYYKYELGQDIHAFD